MSDVIYSTTPHSLSGWLPFSYLDRVYNSHLALALVSVVVEQETLFFSLLPIATIRNPLLQPLAHSRSFGDGDHHPYSSVSSDLRDIAWFYPPSPFVFLDSRTADT